MNRRKICVVTGTRAEYGLLHWLMREIQSDAGLELHVAVTGMHLSPEFGLTYRLIEEDGFEIGAKVEMLLSADTPSGIAKSIGLGVIGFADAFERLRPDIVVVLGDRFEILAAAQAALVARIPIAHIHGGEVTEGAFDESIRHAVTKLAQLHFVTAAPHRKRVIQLGEAPETVFNVGAPGLDALRHVAWVDRAALEGSLGLELRSPVFLLTYHPSTLGDKSPVAAQDEVLAALEEFPDATIIATYPNADTGGRALIARLQEWSAAHAGRVRAFASLGQDRYFNVVRTADVIIGNSSSGLIEVPAMKRPTVNIGDRQKGRLKAASVIDAAEERGAIVAAIERALSPSFRASLPSTESLYGQGDAARRIVAVLRRAPLRARKPFFDLEHSHA